MLKKSLLSIAVAASLLGLSGCNISSTSGNNVDETDFPDAGVYPIFEAAGSKFPTGLDLIFANASATDGTADTDAENKGTENTITNAIDDLDGGISVLHPIDIKMSDSINPTTVNAYNATNPASIATATVFLVKLPNLNDIIVDTMSQPTGFDLTAFNPLDISTIAPLFDASVAATNVPLMAAAQGDLQIEVDVIDLDGGTDNGIRIRPTTPLEAETKYIALVTTGVTEVDGTAITKSPQYQTIQSTPADELFSPSLAAVQSALNAWEGLSLGIVGVLDGDPTNALPGVALVSAFTTGAPTTVLKSMAAPKTKFLALGDATATALAGGIAAAGAYDQPEARTFALIENAFGAGAHQAPVNSATGGVVPNTDVLISQGAIEIPQFTNLIGATGANFSDHWDGNLAVGAVLDGALGNTAGSTPPADANGDYNVTYRFPFATEKRKAVVPVLMFEPSISVNGAVQTASGCNGDAKPAAGWPVIIFQHGITSNRTGALLAGTTLAKNNCSVVVAIDLPQHGIPATAGALLGFGVDNLDATTPANTPFAAAIAAIVGANPDSILANIAERHEGLTADATKQPISMVYSDTDPVGTSGDFFIRTDNFQRTRDNLRQAVLDLLNLNASLVNINTDGNAGTTDLDPTDVHFVGHSLGAIVGATFVSVNNDASVQAANTNLNSITTATLVSPGGALAKLLENSISIGTNLLAGLNAANGWVQGDSNLETYLAVFQNTVDSGDPANFIATLATGGSSDTPVLVVELVGDGATVTSDLVVPNNATAALLADNATTRVETAISPLAGTEPLATLMSAVTKSTIGNTVGTHFITKFVKGDHSTFASGTIGGELTADSVAVVTEMHTEIATFVGSDGASITVADPTLLTADAD